MKNLTLIALPALSVTATAQRKIGLAIGLNRFNVDYRGLSLPDKSILTPSVHLLVERPLTEKFNLLYGLGYTTKGAQDDIDYINDFNEFGTSQSPDPDYLRYTDDSYRKFNYNYLDLPIGVSFKCQWFDIYAGGYLNYFVGGKLRYDLKSEYTGSDPRYGYLSIYPSESKGSEAIKAGNVYEQSDTDFMLKRWNYGVQIGFSARLYKGFTLFGEYSRAVKSNLPDYRVGDKVVKSPDKEYNQGFSLRLAYMLGW